MNRLFAAACILALTSDGTTAPHVARLLVERGYGRTVLTVLENLGGPAETVSFAEATGFALPVGDFYVLALDCAADPGAPLLVPVPGLPDDAFVSDGQLSGLCLKGIMVAEVSPESAIGGPLSLVENGDTIKIDVDARVLDLDVTESELGVRRARRGDIRTAVTSEAAPFASIAESTGTTQKERAATTTPISRPRPTTSRRPRARRSRACSCRTSGSACRARR